MSDGSPLRVISAAIREWSRALQECSWPIRIFVSSNDVLPILWKAPFFAVENKDEREIFRNNGAVKGFNNFPRTIFVDLLAILHIFFQKFKYSRSGNFFLLQGQCSHQGWAELPLRNSHWVFCSYNFSHSKTSNFRNSPIVHRITFCSSRLRHKSDHGCACK